MRHRIVVMCGVVYLLAAGAVIAGAAGDAGTLEPEVDKPTLWSKLEPQWYGYVKLDVAYDGSRSAPGEFAKWAVPEAADDEVTITLNQTCLGLKLGASGSEARFRAGGRVEVDFYGHVDDPDPRIRHAYLDFSWPEADFDIIVGQTSDVISPLYPSTLNYTVAWWAGNIGFRRPQIRATQRFAAGDDELTVEGAVTHNIYDTKVGSVSAEDSGLAVQGRLAYSFARADGPPATLGISGHHAQEKFPPGVTDERCDSWSANLDLSLPLSDRVRLQSELFSGKSLAPYLGGAGQGVDLGSAGDDLHGVHSRGGWLALNMAPRPDSKGRPRFNVGVSIDDVEGDDLSPGARELNRSVFGNVIYSLMGSRTKGAQTGRPPGGGQTGRLDVGVELSHWTTRYKDQDECDALRGQLSLIYKI